MLILIFYLATLAQSLSAPFSYTLYTHKPFIIMKGFIILNFDHIFTGMT
jgi:hypothetical protein